LPNLQTLDLSCNYLTYLPSEIGLMASAQTLHTLNLSGNQLAMIPDSIEQLAHVCYLNVSSNQLTHLPETLINMIQLRSEDCWLLVDYNPLTSLPEQVIEQGTASILLYMRSPVLWYIQMNMFSIMGFVVGLVLFFSMVRRRIAHPRKPKAKRHS